MKKSRKEDWWRLRCDMCGRFIAKPADSYVPFGGYDDIDEPDEVFICEKCLPKEIDFWREMGIVPQRYHHAAYEKELAKELGFTYVVQPGCAWGTWVKTKE